MNASLLCFISEVEEMLLHTENIDEATAEVEAAEVEAAGGHVLLQLGHNLLVAKVPSQSIRIASFKLQSIFQAQHQRKL